MSKFFKAILIIIGVLFFVFLVNLNQGIANLAASFYPAAHFWTHLALFCLEALGFLWLWRGFFGRREHLVFTGKTPEERKRFALALARRLHYNCHIKAAGLNPSDPEQLQQCLALLHKKANEETRKTAERTFLATALSQNGRIDALIVFVSLCRLVWRISSIYNQRPNPAEVLSLYWAVASSTFLAFSLEELDISTEIAVGFGESFHAMAPATMTGGVPFVGAALQKFTSSTIDGAANCYLVLRAGIITRNAYSSLCATEERPGRVAVFKEAGSMLFGMSGYLIEQVTKSLRDTLWGLTKSAGNTAVQATVHAGQSLADGAVRMGEGISSGTAAVAYATGGLIKNVGMSAVTGVTDAAMATGRCVTRAVIETGKTAVAPFRKKE